MHVEILLVPYDSGHRAVGMGRGPLHLIEYGLEDALRSAGHRVLITPVDCDVDPPTEVAVAFDLARTIATAVGAARAAGRFPLVLSGNCISAIGTVAGLGADVGVLWLDAHADLNTPESTRSGFLDGMAAAVLTGRCWRELVGSVPGMRPVEDRRLVLIGARDLDPPEQALLDGSGIGHVAPASVRERGARDAVAPLVAGMTGGDGPARFYLHVDLDVLDPSIARANRFAAPGGLTVEHVVAVAGLAADAGTLAGAAITAFDPAFDDHGRDSAAATRIALGILRQAG